MRDFFLFKGQRVIVPTELRSDINSRIHQGPGGGGGGGSVVSGQTHCWVGQSLNKIACHSATYYPRVSGGCYHLFQLLMLVVYSYLIYC